MVFSFKLEEENNTHPVSFFGRLRRIVRQYKARSHSNFETLRLSKVKPVTNRSVIVTEINSKSLAIQTATSTTTPRSQFNRCMRIFTPNVIGTGTCCVDVLC